VLELGFGNGAFLAWARGRGASVYGIEASSTLVQRARSKFGQDRAFGDVEQLRVQHPEARFELIAAFDVLEHVPPAEVVDLLRLLRSLLAPTGRLVVRFPNGDSPFGRVTQHGDPTHVNTIGGFKLSYYAQQAGLAVVSLRSPRLPIRGVGLRRGVRRAMQIAARQLFERIVGQLYFGGRSIPLDPNYTAVLDVAKIHEEPHR
jgi:SAM-dependent methyltransferase